LVHLPPVKISEFSNTPPLPGRPVPPSFASQLPAPQPRPTPMLRRAQSCPCCCCAPPSCVLPPPGPVRTHPKPRSLFPDVPSPRSFPTPPSRAVDHAVRPMLLLGPPATHCAPTRRLVGCCPVVPSCLRAPPPTVTPFWRVGFGVWFSLLPPPPPRAPNPCAHLSFHHNHVPSAQMPPSPQG